ncbi:hypothetical protein [Actinomadura sp. HBU206391]|uniref:hypothetical protein n=1 Tax=Actinomadura sp. HBU206391 TaxID=2731692 RepID=UPI00164FCF30|nr:hypothetical protein [Actinomadura sp. HBU206391]MBC6463676.1 hypothetical protein [Actinomadura sp. HBU206391]
MNRVRLALTGCGRRGVILLLGLLMSAGADAALSAPLRPGAYRLRHPPRAR